MCFWQRRNPTDFEIEANWPSELTKAHRFIILNHAMIAARFVVIE